MASSITRVAFQSYYRIRSLIGLQTVIILYDEVKLNRVESKKSQIPNSVHVHVIE